MSTFKNIHGMPIHIPFGDFEPVTEFHYHAETRCLTINNEDYGAFSQEGFDKILIEWTLFNDAYHWDANVGRWFERDRKR